MIIKLYREWVVHLDSSGIDIQNDFLIPPATISSLGTHFAKLSSHKSKLYVLGFCKANQVCPISFGKAVVQDNVVH